MIDTGVGVMFKRGDMNVESGAIGTMRRRGIDHVGHRKYARLGRPRTPMALEVAA
jgi:hypothetical protein